MSTPTHFIEWEFDTDGVRADAVCTAADDADCRLSCAEHCEEWGAIDRDANGPYHLAYDEGSEDWTVRHQMRQQDYCNITEFLNADYSLLPELGSGQFVIARTPIEPVWEGDSYSWKQAES